MASKDDLSDGPQVVDAMWLHFHRCSCGQYWGCFSRTCLVIRGSHLVNHPLTGRPVELHTIADVCRTCKKRRKS
jgi:hypothetical protein